MQNYFVAIYFGLFKPHSSNTWELVQYQYLLCLISRVLLSLRNLRNKGFYSIRKGFVVEHMKQENKDGTGSPMLMWRTVIKLFSSDPGVAKGLIWRRRDIIWEQAFNQNVTV